MQDVILAVIPGLLIGILFGLALQRGRFCMNSAFRDPLLLKEYKLLFAVFLAIFVQMIGFGIMAGLNIITLNPKPLMLVAQILGGFVFGIGMAFAGGCASGTTYRVGEGMMGSLVALIGLAIGAVAMASGALAGFRTEVQGILNFGQLTLGGDFNWILMVIIGVVGFIFFLWKFILPEKDELSGFNPIKKAWPWWFTGIFIGILAWFAWVSSAAAGRNYPFGITAGWKGWLDWINGTPAATALGWLSWMVLGIILGAFIFSYIAGEWKLRAPQDGKTLLLQFFGGLLMGGAAVLAAGCNIGNILSGWPQLSIGSLVAGVFIILGNWFMTYLLFMRGE